MNYQHPQQPQQQYHQPPPTNYPLQDGGDKLKGLALAGVAVSGCALLLVLLAWMRADLIIWLVVALIIAGLVCSGLGLIRARKDDGGGGLVVIGLVCGLTGLLTLIIVAALAILVTFVANALNNVFPPGF